MNSDLQHLIELQELELTAERVRRRVADMPQALAALDERLAARRTDVAAVKERLAANTAARREIEKDLAAVQARLSKYKDQLMEVKTNKEYQAMQTEIAVAEQHVRGHEDRLLERMEETEALTAARQAADAALKAEEGEVAREQAGLEAERVALVEELRRTGVEHGSVSAKLSAHALSLFQHVARHRKGVALSEARDGHCTQCHVRLRPQVFNDVRRNDALLQCESCSRILYFVPAAASTAAPHSS